MADFLSDYFSTDSTAVFVVIHEVSHGAAAYRLGDPTAKLMGRLDFKSDKASGFFRFAYYAFFRFYYRRFVFGWASPVSLQSRQSKIRGWGRRLLLSPAPLSNFSLAVIFSLAARFLAGSAAGFAGEADFGGGFHFGRIHRFD